VRNTVVLQKLFITQKRAVRIRTNLSWHAHTYPLIRKKQAHLQFRNYISCRWHVLCLQDAQLSQRDCAAGCVI